MLVFASSLCFACTNHVQSNLSNTNTERKEQSVCIRVDLLHNFYLCTCIKCSFTNKIEAMQKRSLVSVKVEPRSTSHLSSALFMLPLFYLCD